jgi:hypothetical protein
MGLTVVLAHFNGTQWKNFTVEPPGGNYNDYAVVGLKLGRNVVHVSYKATGPGIYLISLTVDPSIRALSNVRKHEISLEKWKSLRMLGAE